LYQNGGGNFKYTAWGGGKVNECFPQAHEYRKATVNILSGILQDSEISYRDTAWGMARDSDPAKKKLKHNTD